jgi:hypothetical protein
MGMSQAPPPVIVSQMPAALRDPGSSRSAPPRSPETEAAVRRAKARGPVPAPANREEILERLRERAKRITASGPSSSKKA